MPTELFFDIETKKLFEEIDTHNPADLGISIVSVYKRKIDNTGKEIEGQMFSFWEDDFPKMWPLFTNVDRVVGYNSLGFDIPALAPLCPYDFKKLIHFDMLDAIKNKLGFRLSLNSVATETINASKIDVGTNAPLYWAQQTEESLSKLKYYCEADVAITRDVYDFVMKNSYLKYKDKWNTVRQFEIDFSYPKQEKHQENQMGLF